jgi:hypothetical protein
MSLNDAANTTKRLVDGGYPGVADEHIHAYQNSCAQATCDTMILRCNFDTDEAPERPSRSSAAQASAYSPEAEFLKRTFMRFT